MLATLYWSVTTDKNKSDPGEDGDEGEACGSLLSIQRLLLCQCADTSRIFFESTGCKQHLISNLVGLVATNDNVLATRVRDMKLVVVMLQQRKAALVKYS